ncbi:MAG: M81 family metallopeptidase [Planctomycetes bacterium]|nr:M81 family metallopeptidase [Planctomycetota bacterium]
MKIAVGGIMHESNSFSVRPTTLESFRESSLLEGEAIRAVWGPAHHEVGGFLAGAQTHGFEAVPTLMAWATPSGMVQKRALDALTGRWIDLLAGGRGLDGLLLALHGAMVLEGHEDGDAEILRRLRRSLGRDFPIVCTLDFHANVSEDMVALSNALVIYRTNPHTDQRERGLQAAELIARLVRGEIRPRQALAKPPMIFPILHQNTSKPPLIGVMDEARAREKDSRILVANVAIGFPYADVPELGPAAVVVTQGDAELAQREADRLSEALWALRDRLGTNLPDAAGAVRLALESDRRPVVLVEMGDNIGGGSPGDSTFILAELLRQKAEHAVVVLYDPEAVQTCLRAGVRQEVEIRVGGKTDRLHGEPVMVRGRVHCLHEGRYEETEVRHGGKRFNDQGVTAVVECPGQNLVALTSLREPPFSLQQLVSLGIAPERQHVLVVKAAIAYRAAYEPIAGRIIEVDTPGATTPNPARLDYCRIRRPMFPLDAIREA